MSAAELGDVRKGAAPHDATLSAVERSTAERSTNVDVSSLLMLQGPHARAILILFLVSQALLAFVGVGDEAPYIGVTLLAFVPLALAAVWVVHPATDPLPAKWTAGVLMLCAVTITVQTLHLGINGWPLSATWHLGAVTTVLFMLILRGRVAMGWLGYLLIAASTIAWAAWAGPGVNTGIELVVRHAATLLVGTAIFLGLRGTARRISAINRVSLAEAAAEATAHASQDERLAQLAHLDAMARPMLEQIAAAHELSDAEKRSCLLIEASLRDVVRGHGLAFAHVLAAARAARERGVEVTLLDDSELSWGPASVGDLLAHELRALQSGSLTARLQPQGRDEVASIVIAPLDGPARMLVVDLAGRVVAV